MPPRRSRPVRRADGDGDDQADGVQLYRLRHTRHDPIDLGVALQAVQDAARHARRPEPTRMYDRLHERTVRHYVNRVGICDTEPFPVRPRRERPPASTLIERST